MAPTPQESPGLVEFVFWQTDRHLIRSPPSTNGTQFFAMNPRLSLLAMTAIGFSLVSSVADTHTRTAARDTCLFEKLPGYNWGAEPELVAGVLGTRSGGVNRCRILMGFDLGASIPPGSTITAVELRLSVVKAPNGAAPATFQLLRVLTPWLEGNLDGAGNPGGAPAEIRQATWDHRIHTTGAWASPGGQIGVDFATVPSASQTVTGSPPTGTVTDYVFTFNATGLADVTEMVNDPFTDFGWVLVADDEVTPLTARRWGSSEHPTARPEITVTFTPPPPPPIFEITSALLDGGDLVVEFNSRPGRVYAFDYRTDLASGDWVEVNDSIESEGTSTTFRTPAPPGARRLFFQVRQVGF